MMKFKTLYDKDAPTNNLVTTIGGFVTLVISILSTLGVFTPEQAATATTHTATLLSLVPGVVGAIMGLIGIFKAKDV